MARIANNYTAILSGTSWWGANVANKPVFITYSFESRPYDYLAEFGYSAAYIRSFRPFTATERAEATNALNQWDNASGIHFLQVPAGQGDIRFANYNLALDPDGADAAAYTYEPDTAITRARAYSNDYGGDIFFDISTSNYPREDLRHVMVREIGHAIGLKHPFEGAIQLDAAHDTSAYTVMSYAGYSPRLGPYDIAAARHLYGLPTHDGDQVAHWSWNSHSHTLTQTGGSGGEMIRGVSTADVIYGMGGSDVIFGSAGNDTIHGGAGADAMTGGDGADQFVFDAAFTSGVDRLTDFQHGTDKLILDHTVLRELPTGHLAASAFHVGSAAHDANDHIIFNTATDSLYYDVDGIGGHAPVRFAVLNHAATLTALDFLILA